MKAGLTSKVDSTEGTGAYLKVVLLDFDFLPSSVKFLADLLLQRHQLLVCPVGPRPPFSTALVNMPNEIVRKLSNPF